MEKSSQSHYLDRSEPWMTSWQAHERMHFGSLTLAAKFQIESGKQEI